MDRDSARSAAGIRRRWFTGVGVALALVFTAAACGNDEEQRSNVDRLEAEIGAMAGVESFSANYADDFTHGTNLDTSVRMPAATVEEVEAVARRIDEVGNQQFDGFDRSTDFIIGENLQLSRRAEVLPEGIAADTRAARQLRAALPAGEIEWFRSRLAGSWLELSEMASSGVETFAAARAAVGDEPTDVRIRPAEPGQMWSATFPLPVDREQAIRRALAGTPLPPISIGVEDGAVTRLGVGVSNPGPTTSDDLVAAITATDAVRGPSLDFEWHADRSGDGQNFSGSVDVGGCSYPQNLGEKSPERYYTPEALAVQKRIREQFDTCP